MTRQFKKGQAAMEFLMTYGWAILAAIIAIGVLAYFGVFNPSRLASSAGVLSPPLNVESFNIVSDGCSSFDCVNIEVLQNSGESITSLSNVSLTITSGSATSSISCEDATSLPTSWVSGSKQTFVFDCGSASEWAAGASVSADVSIKYTAAGSSLPQTSTGNVRGVSQ